MRDLQATRFLIYDYMDLNVYDKILYTDYDVLFYGDVNRLFEYTDKFSCVQEQKYIMAKNFGKLISYHKIRAPKGTKGYNSGTFCFDVSYGKEMLKEIYDTFYRYEPVIHKLNDQCVFNYIVHYTERKNDIKIFPDDWYITNPGPRGYQNLKQVSFAHYLGKKKITRMSMVLQQLLNDKKELLVK